MIFVVTGVHYKGFNRLIKAVDDLAGGGVIKDVFIQTGFSSYRPKNCDWSKVLDWAEFARRMDEADIIITHGGAGCIADALERNKPAIVVPRLKKYDERNNNHQLELALALERANRVLVVRQMSGLAEAISRARNFKPHPAVKGNNLVELLTNFLKRTAEQKNCLISTQSRPK